MALAFVALGMAAANPAKARSETITLTPSDTFVVSLRENVSTGYRWRVVQTSGKDVASILDAGSSPIASDRRIIGGPSMRRWHVTAGQPGTATFEFSYARPWEKNPPAETFHLTVSVPGR